MPNSAESLHLAFDFHFADLYDRDSLARLDGIFLDHLKAADLAIFNTLMEGRAHPEGVERKKYAELLIALAPHVDSVVGLDLSEELVAAGQAGAAANCRLLVGDATALASLIVEKNPSEPRITIAQLVQSPGFAGFSRTK